VQGAKNSVLPVLAGTVLCGGESVVHNCPMLSDVETSLKILEHLGCKCRREGGAVIVDSSGISEYDIPDSLMREMRSSVVFLGAVIGRMGRAETARHELTETIDLHLSALKEWALQ
ncbi:MAG: UDP-N-acetylglucosamine 1-carboxyvinyltransferase, partial [Oscillospiraceae bacterium]